MKLDLATALFIRIAKLLLILSFLAPCSLALDNIIISEVLYDPLNTETGGEAVEIYNPTADAIDIGGWTIRTEASTADATIPSNTVLSSKQFYLIADSGWSSLRDNLDYDIADHEEAMTLSNSDSGVAIVDKAGVIIDAVGWGSASGITGNLYEGTPAPMLSPGSSLQRAILTDDSGNNVADFIATTPTPRNSTIRAEPTDIIITIPVEDTPALIVSFTFPDEDMQTAGFQLIPEPGKSKTFNFTVMISDSDGVSNISTIGATLSGPDTAEYLTLSQAEQLNSTCARFKGSFDMEYYNSPGQYTMMFDTTNITFEYYSAVAMELDTKALGLPKTAPGSASEVKGDYALSTSDRPTIRNTGNVLLDIAIKGEDLLSGTGRIAFSSIIYSIGTYSAAVSSSETVIPIGLAPGEDSVMPFSIKIAVPTGTQKGNYTGKVTLTAKGR